MGHSLKLHLFAWCLIQAALCQTDYTTEVSATELYTAFGTAVDGAVTEDAANALYTGSASGAEGTATGGTASAGTALGAGATASGSASGEQANDTLLLLANETAHGELLAHEASEQSSVVFVADPEGYVPIQPVQPARPTRPAKKTASSTSSTSSTASTPSSTPPPGRLQAAASDSPEYRAPLETWDRDYRRLRSNNTRVQHIEAECQDDYMKIRIGFNGSFGGLLYSSGYAYDPECVYINGTGRDYYEFYIQLNRCGTLGKNSLGEDSRKNPTKNFMWNTVTVQYNPMIEEEWDEHFKVTCEYGYDFWKTVTFPFLDVEVATGNPVVFTLSPPECYMEIRYGYGTGGTRVTGPVRVGDPLTLIIYMRSKYDGFDIVVNDCWAHNGGNKRIQLIDQYGCPVDDKLISRFRGTWSEQGAFETQVFAYMKTFRFTGSPALYIECDVRMCHGRCPSQPCHWRNAKSVSKRSVGAPLGLAGPPGTSLGQVGAQLGGQPGAGQPTQAPALSENVNLFQSLRVLQEGESLDGVTSANSTLTDQLNSVCLKSGSFQTLLGLGCSLLCLLASTVLVLCCRVRRLSATGQSKTDRLASLGSGLGPIAGVVGLGGLGGLGPGLGPLGEPRFDHGTFMTHKGRIN